MKLIKSLLSRLAGNPGAQHVDDANDASAGSISSTQAKPTGFSDVDKVGGASETGLAKTKVAKQSGNAITAAAKTVATLPAKYPRPTGELAKKVNLALDFRTGSGKFKHESDTSSQANRDLDAARFMLAEQVAVADGTAHSLKNKAPSEIAERQEIARAFAGELTHRVMTGSSVAEAFKTVPHLEDALVTKNAAEAQALALTAEIGRHTAKLEGALWNLDKAVEAGFELDFSERLIIKSAQQNLETDPKAGLLAIDEIDRRADAFLEAKRGSSYGDFGSKVAFMHDELDDGAEEQMEMEVDDGSLIPVGPLGGGGSDGIEVVQAGPEGVDLSDITPVEIPDIVPATKGGGAPDIVPVLKGGGAPKPKELSPEEIEAKVKANIDKAAAHVEELRAGLPDTKPTTESKFKAALIGCAVGDCLGSTVEFMSQGRIRLEHGFVTDLIGGGPFNWEPGEYTDDTQMAAAMARAIVKSGGFDATKVADNFGKWLDTKPKDVGGLTRKTVHTYKSGIPADMSGWIPWALDGYDNAGNGSVMRAAPVAMLTAFSSEAEIIDAAIKSSEITHADPRCTWGTAAIALGVSMLLKGEEDVATKVAAKIKPHSPTVAAALEAVPDMGPADLKTTGYVVDTVQAAFFAVEHFDNYVEAIVVAANNGDDTDTAGATAGILLGAKHGLEGIPETWKSKVKGKEELDSLASGLWKLANG